jgi:acetyl esterase/lipase
MTLMAGLAKALRRTSDINPELRRVARFLPRQLVYSWSVPLIRRVHLREGPDDGVELLTLPDGPGLRLYRPADAAGRGPALLWIHGGGYVIGTAAEDDELCRRFAQRLGIVVAAVDYRLAPEHPYPAPVEDCYRALTWLADQPDVDPDRIVIGGLSAGGGLTAALAFLARDRGEVRPALQVLSQPMLDDRSVDPALDRSGFRIWNTGSNRVGWSAYLGGADPAEAVPARRDDLAGLPPAWLGVGTQDLFHDEGVRHAKRLRDAGVPCVLHVSPGGFHGFDQVAPKAPVSRAYFDSQCTSISNAVALVR